MHVKKNGEGELVITATKLMLSFVTVMLLILGSVITYAVNYGILNNKMDNNIDDIKELILKDKEKSKNIQENELNIGIINAKLDAIKEIIERIEKKLE